jgi:hypothetical protein
MMETNNVLLWMVGGYSIRALPKIEEPRLKIKELHLTVSESDTAQQRGRRY